MPALFNGQKGQMGQVNYSAAKAGDIGFVKALAQENANKGITVNAICPGYIGTEMVQAIDPEVLSPSIGMALGDTAGDVVLVVGSIACERGNRTRDLVEQGADL